MAHSAVGRTFKVLPSDFGAAFEHSILCGRAVGPGPLGYYVGTITSVDGRSRRPVNFELREMTPVEDYSWEKDRVRDRLILSAGEDMFVVLPSGATPKKKAPAKKAKRAMLANSDTTP
jgi:hypothetical protein